MPISDKDLEYIQGLLPKLKPQPYTAQLKETFEFMEAETKYKLQVTGVIFAVGLYKVAVMKDGEGPYYETLWACNSRPYIRLYDKASGELFDVFLLPPA